MAARRAVEANVSAAKRASEDDFASEDDEDDEEGDPMAVPPARQRAFGRAAAAQAEGDTVPNKEAEVVANRRAIKAPADNPRDPA